ncbi:MAG: type II toxin-antitoxin system VapC family toxin [Dehalococcoidia bacterium]|nr:type II toxin-antitoxin system VapC family toxin [Dehalococcoidia bacterium]
MTTRPTTVMVVDASVAVKWHLTDEEYGDQAIIVLERFAAGQLELVAPEHIRYEVLAAITVATLGRQPRLTIEQGEEAIAEFLALGIGTVRDSDLIMAAYPLVHRYGCALYDVIYLAVAQRLKAPLITADNKLYRLVGDTPHILWIGDYPAGPEGL